MTKQGLYAYPKAHAVVLAYLAYTTAYLKTHFPQEFTRAALCVVARDNINLYEITIVGIILNHKLYIYRLSRSLQIVLFFLSDV